MMQPLNQILAHTLQIAALLSIPKYIASQQSILWYHTPRAYALLKVYADFLQL